ncbi:amidohydrolase [Citricoccus sp. SGAir0253]|uniref:amidohydrolase family protein n=1 Tax=Citricoccus sp. SGAir0253 TaxID=2567881 RepID=UPI0010CD1EA6|nr:amidohydrolase family protein [Citricoccus sp. SGAir0253]QCU79180.1 amidohydrolase [Citricoccus sp. SGAir0253]
MAHTPAPRSDAELRPYLDALGLPGIVDLHVHFMPANVQEKVWAFFDAEAERGGPPWHIEYRHSEEYRVRVLRDLGVSAYGTLNYAHRPGMAAWLNDYSAAFAAEHPDAIHSATLYPEDGVDAEVARSLERGARLFKVHVQVGGFSPLDPRLDHAWRSLEEAAVPVVIHCGSGPHPGEFTGPGRIRELVDRHPGLVLVIAHAGLPEYLEFAALAAESPNVYLDTTMVGTGYMEQQHPAPERYPEVLAALEGKVVFGSDFPSIPYPYSHQVEALVRWGMDDEWMRTALWHTPHRILGADGVVADAR